LGGWEGSAWEDRVLAVGPDETLLMYTDGVTDTRGEAERFGAARLRRLLGESAGGSPAELLSSLERELDKFQAEGHADDTGAVALRLTATGALVSVGEGSADSTAEAAAE
jgi:serine phosphatase RsbU (regulator of sigma subunit)